MSTPYETLFKSFLSKISDNALAAMPQDEAEEDMIDLLNSAIIYFEYPKVDIFDRDDILFLFTNTLSMFEIEILANLMKLEWIKRHINSISLIQQAMTDKDFKLTSQANHLKVLLDLRNATELEVEKLKTKYSYSNNRQANFDGLAGG